MSHSIHRSPSSSPASQQQQQHQHPTSYLTIKEIVPCENEKGEVTHVYDRVHLILSKYGVFEFPKRSHGSNWSQLTCKSSNDQLNAISYYGLSSYFIFTRVTWTSSKIVLEWQRFHIEKQTKKKAEKQKQTQSDDTTRKCGCSTTNSDDATVASSSSKPSVFHNSTLSGIITNDFASKFLSPWSTTNDDNDDASCNCECCDRSQDHSHIVIEPVTMSHTWMNNEFYNNGIAYMSLGKRFYEKCRFSVTTAASPSCPCGQQRTVPDHSLKQTTAMTQQHIIGSTFEISLSICPSNSHSNIL